MPHSLFGTIKIMLAASPSRAGRDSRGALVRPSTPAAGLVAGTAQNPAHLKISGQKSVPALHLRILFAILSKFACPSSRTLSCAVFSDASSLGTRPGELPFGQGASQPLQLGCSIACYWPARRGMRHLGVPIVRQAEHLNQPRVLLEQRSQTCNSKCTS